MTTLEIALLVLVVILLIVVYMWYNGLFLNVGADVCKVCLDRYCPKCQKCPGCSCPPCPQCPKSS